MYARLIIRETQHHGGQGWLDHDRVFRQQAALDPSMRWNILQTAIQASTLFNPSVSTMAPGIFCSLCRGVDHTSAACALAYLQQPSSRAAIFVASNRPLPHPARKRATVALCIFWNRGKCLFPGTCTFRHVYSVCSQQHATVVFPNRATRRSATSAASPPRY